MLFAINLDLHYLIRHAHNLIKYIHFRTIVAQCAPSRNLCSKSSSFAVSLFTVGKSCKRSCLICKSFLQTVFNSCSRQRYRSARVVYSISSDDNCVWLFVLFLRSKQSTRNKLYLTNYLNVLIKHNANCQCLFFRVLVTLSFGLVCIVIFLFSWSCLNRLQWSGATCLAPYSSTSALFSSQASGTWLSALSRVPVHRPVLRSALVLP